MSHLGVRLSAAAIALSTFSVFAGCRSTTEAPIGGGGEGGGGDGRAETVPCSSDKECTPSGRLCDPALFFCVECVGSDGCASGTCSAGKCVEAATCETSLDCATEQVCSEALQVCVECEADSDCSAGATCREGRCASTCSEAADCPNPDERCSEALGLCVGGTVCEPGRLYCAGERGARCREDGAGFTPPGTCAEPCFELGGEAVCEGLIGGAGGSMGTGGGSPGTGGSSGGGNPNVLLGATFDSAAVGWALSGGAPYQTPSIESGKVCESLGSYTLGWPAGDSPGLSLQPGDYELSFTLDVGEVDPWDSVEVKLALADYPYEPVHFSEVLDNLSGASGVRKFSFTMNSAAMNVGLAFNVSGIESKVCFDDVLLERVDR